MSAATLKPVRVNSRGIATMIGIAPVYGARDGVLGDTLLGDVHVLPPSEHSINPRGRRMYRVTTRFDRLPTSYHKSEGAAVRAMRRTIRAYYSRESSK